MVNTAERSMNCPKCNHSISEWTHFCPQCSAAIVAAPEPFAREASQEGAAHIEVSQQVGTVEAGRVVGVDLGEVLGDVNIGNYTLRIGTLNGGVVNVAPPQQRQVTQPRPVPVMLLPRPFSGFLDRKEEVSAAAAVLEGASPVEFHGPSGVGKTTLLHYLAHHKFAPVFPAGILSFSEIHHRPVEDLLLELFDAFYDRDPTYLPTPVQMRHALRDERALVVLDDVDLEREEVEALMNAAPASVFLSAATERRLWSGGRTIALPGLPPEDALTLIERELGRPLGEEERNIFGQLHTSLAGYPLRLLQLGALVRDERISLAEVAERLQQHASSVGGSVGEALKAQLLATRSEDEQRVLAALAVPMGASVGEEHLNELAGVADARPALESLQRRKLVQAHSPRYSLTGSLDETLREEWDLTPWYERALVHFATWAEEQRHDPERVIEEADAILGVLQRSAQNGRWEGILRLGRATEGQLAVRGHWGAWAQTLEWQLEAARQVGDRAAKAWSLHQSGTRALCLEDTPTARRDLSEALRLRESLGDREGAAVTRHNLNLLGGFGGNNGPEGNGSGDGMGGLGRWPLLVGAIVVVAILGLLVSRLGAGEGIWERILPTPSGNESPQGGDQPGGGGAQPGGGGGGTQPGGEAQPGSGAQPGGGGGGTQPGGGGGTTGDRTTGYGTTGDGTTGDGTTGDGTTGDGTTGDGTTGDGTTGDGTTGDGTTGDGTTGDGTTGDPNCCYQEETSYEGA